jgi:2-keto-3-deoxy-L-rhamnonate aldolase RhmA
VALDRHWLAHRNSRAFPDYLTSADDEICLLAQVENRAGLAALDDILETDGIDGVFIGPADLAADMGYIGKPGGIDVSLFAGAMRAHASKFKQGT